MKVITFIWFIKKNPVETDLDVNMEDGIDVKIEPTRTDAKFLNIFSLDYVYHLKVEHTVIAMLEKATNKVYNFEIE